MGLPLGPVLANIFMVQLECDTIPKLRDTVQGWKRCVYVTFTYVKNDSVPQVLDQLNAF